MSFVRRQPGWITLALVAAWCVVVHPGKADDAPAAPKPRDVWLDVDTATGFGDVDDGLMVIQAFHSPEVRIRGISVVFGNTTLERAVPIAREIVERFGPEGLSVQAGAASAEELGQETDATRALAGALEERPLTVLAVGPVTNIGTLLKRHPELASRIERLIMVAARRPGQRFKSSDTQQVPHRDFNFELDPAAMQIILDTQIPLVFAPWEVSSHVWLGRDELARLRGASKAGAWIAETSEYWIALWERDITPRGFNPFDTLALGWVTHPQLIESMPVTVQIEQAADDRATAEERAAGKMKPYLHVRPLAEGETPARSVIYCHTPQPGFTPLLLERLSGKSL
ncbi:MAG: nucleoside hydrolase [Pirellulales bacterium]|nr:nucleoside hydrolase [Pirellulales bacterium]